MDPYGFRVLKGTSVGISILINEIELDAIAAGAQGLLISTTTHGAARPQFSREEVVLALETECYKLQYLASLTVVWRVLAIVS